MAINLGAEVALAIHLDQALTYGDIESALVDAGFTNYTIMRNLNYDGSSDAQLFVRAEQTQDGSMHSLPAAETLTMLSQALGAMEGSQPAPNVTPDAGNGGGDSEPDSGEVTPGDNGEQQQSRRRK